MFREKQSGFARMIAAVALLAVVLAGTAMADSLLPERAATAAPAEEIGRAGFAYLTGIRTFAAAVLWNRLDPILHDYYEGIPLAEHTYMLPTINAIVTLDPQFEQSYFVASWMLTQRGQVEEGVGLARLGVENNPESGTLLANYAQILWLVLDDVDAAAEQARVGVSEETQWNSLVAQWEGYAVFRDIFRAAGDTALADRIVTEMEWIDSEIVRLGIDTTPH